MRFLSPTVSTPSLQPHDTLTLRAVTAHSLEYNELDDSAKEQLKQAARSGLEVKL